MDLMRHADAVVPDERLGRDHPPYKPTYLFGGEFLNDNHRFLATCPVRGERLDLGIEGWLRREDALKLYELAYFSPTDILELGCFKGLSTAILSQANHDVGLKNRIVTIDLEPICSQLTFNNLAARQLIEGTEVLCGDAIALGRRLIAERRRFGLLFVDHSHAYQPVYDVCQLADDLVVPGGFCLFHDYNDRRNLRSDDDAYGVVKAVRDGLNNHYFEFYGIFGCTALFRRTSTPARDNNRA